MIWDKFSRTQDQDFRCFYPCEIILLSHIPVPACEKGKKQPHTHRSLTSLTICNVKITSPCRISAYSGFLEDFFMVFQKNEVFSGEQEKEYIIRVRMG